MLFSKGFKTVEFLISALISPTGYPARPIWIFELIWLANSADAEYRCHALLEGIEITGIEASAVARTPTGLYSTRKHSPIVSSSASQLISLRAMLGESLDWAISYVLSTSYC
jgi:hypothetical protein